MESGHNFRNIYKEFDYIELVMIKARPRARQFVEGLTMQVEVDSIYAFLKT